MVAAALLGSSLLWAGCSSVDVLVGASLAWLPAWLRPADLALRRQRRRREMPVMLALALVVPPAATAPAVIALEAPWPLAELLLGGAYLFAWMFALRMLREVAEAAARRWCRNRGVATPLAASAVVALGGPLLLASLQIHRIKVAQPVPANSGAPLTLRCADGVELAATFRAQAEPALAVVLCHGVGANRANVAPHAALLHRLGCHVLSFDFRGHGESGGHTVTFGAHETRDVAAAVAWLRGRADVRGVALVGISMGGATVLLAGAELQVAGVFAESAFAELREMSVARLRGVPWLADALATAIGWAARAQPGVDIDAIAPRRTIVRIRPDCPVVLLHAGDDQVVPLAQGQALAAERRIDLEVFADAAHGLCMATDPLRYRGLLRQFLASALRTPGG